MEESRLDVNAGVMGEQGGGVERKKCPKKHRKKEVEEGWSRSP